MSHIRTTAIFFLTAFLFLLTVPVVNMSTVQAADFDVVEQQFVYELNKARQDPGTYGNMFFDGAAQAAMQTTEPRPPLAVVNMLSASAEFHSQEMADYNYFNHQSDVTGEWSNALALRFNYPLPSWWDADNNYIESIAAGYVTPRDALQGFAASEGHRVHLWGQPEFFAKHREIGAGYVYEPSSSYRYYYTIHTAYRDSLEDQPFLTGVIYDDVNNNGWMDMGEGVAGAQVSISGTSVYSNPGGGWSIPVSAGTYNVSITSAAFTGTINQTYIVDYDNVWVEHTTQDANVANPTTTTTTTTTTVPGTTTTTVPKVSTLDRYAGANRYATSVEISRNVWPDGSNDVYVAVGDNFPDALAAVPAAGIRQAPILLVAKNSVPREVATELVRLQPERIYIVGGAGVIADATMRELDSLGTWQVSRIWGSDRFNTSVAISQHAFPSGAQIAYLAVGDNFPDALAAGVPAARNGGPILLTGKSTIPSAVLQELRRLSPEEVIIAGGIGVIDEEAVGELRSAGFSVRRVAGATRYHTSVALRNEASAGSAFFVSTGVNFPDALAGGPAAVVAGKDLILVDTNSVPSIVDQMLQNESPTSIVILGGYGAISYATGEQLSLY